MTTTSLRSGFAALAVVNLLCFHLPAAAQSFERSEQELTCLALNVYHEARNQSLEGQLAVAHVTLNRAEARAPTTICQTVYRGWDFSWTRDPRKQQPPADQQAWGVAQMVARWALDDRDSDPVRGSTFFHSIAVSPAWAPALVRVRQIGDHVFYRDTETAAADAEQQSVSQ